MGRIKYIDALKGFSILWVVIIHFGDWIPEYIQFPVRLPLFFFLSGFFFRSKRCFKEFIYKKLNTLIIPFFFFWVLGVLFNLVCEVLSNYNFSLFLYVRGFLKLFTIIPHDATLPNPLLIGAIWFLLGLFILQFIYYFLKKYIYFTFGRLLLCLIISEVSIFLINHYCAMGSLCYSIYSLQFLIYYALGDSIISHLALYLNGQERKWHYTLGIFVLTILASVLINNQYLNFVNYTLISISLIVVFHYSQKSKIIDLLAFYGKNSIIVLGTHALILSMCSILGFNSIFQITNNEIFVLICLLVIVMLIEVPIILFLNKFLPMFVAKKDILKY